MRASARAAAVAVAVVAMLQPRAVRAQGVELQYHWKQGDVAVYRTTLKTTSTVSGMPGGDPVTFDQTMTQRIKLLAAAVGPDGTATLHQTIEAVQLEMNTPVGKVRYDSAEPRPANRDEGSEALGRVFGGVVGSTISVVMAANGTIQRIDGVAKVLDKITRDLPQSPAAIPMAQSLKSVLSENAVRASLEQSFPRLPPQAVKPGDTWTAPVSLGSEAIGRISGTQTFTLKAGGGAAGGLATIAVVLALKQESTPPVGPSGMTVRLGDSRGEGEMAFDVAGGRIRRSTMRTEMPSVMTTTGPDGRPATMKSTTTTSMMMEEVR